MLEILKEEFKRQFQLNPYLTGAFKHNERLFEVDSDAFRNQMRGFLSMQPAISEPRFNDFFFEDSSSVNRVHAITTICLIVGLSAILASIALVAVPLAIGASFLVCATVLEAGLAIVSCFRYVAADNTYKNNLVDFAVAEQILENYEATCTAFENQFEEASSQEEVEFSDEEDEDIFLSADEDDVDDAGLDLERTGSPIHFGKTMLGNFSLFASKLGVDGQSLGQQNQVGSPGQ